MFVFLFFFGVLNVNPSSNLLHICCACFYLLVGAFIMPCPIVSTG